MTFDSEDRIMAVPVRVARFHVRRYEPIWFVWESDFFDRLKLSGAREGALGWIAVIRELGISGGGEP